MSFHMNPLAFQTHVERLLSVSYHVQMSSAADTAINLAMLH